MSIILNKKKAITDDMDMDDLENGDLLISNGHYEFVLCDEGEKLSNGKTKKINFRQFGWGSVKNRYPIENADIRKEGSTYKDNKSGITYTYIIRLPKNINEDGK